MVMLLRSSLCIPLAKPKIKQELSLCPYEEEFEHADKTLHIYMIEQSLVAKPPTEDDLISQFINSSLSRDFMELLSSFYATQQIENIPSSSTTPDTTSTLHGD